MIYKKPTEIFIVKVKILLLKENSTNVIIISERKFIQKGYVKK